MPKNNATIFCVLGATGDLSQKKILPALFDLYHLGSLPKVFNIIGVAKNELSNNEFRSWAEKAIFSDRHKHSSKKVRSFVKRINYLSGDFKNKDTYTELGQIVKAKEKKFGPGTNKLYYLAVPPQFFSVISSRIADSGLTKHCDMKHGWSRVLIEKPFGTDYKAAEQLDKKLCRLFKDEQVFRIDHYLAKEATQNILAFRFSNYIFEPLWSKEHIERIETRLWEKGGIGRRGGFYDSVGALMDVGQNHILAMLALVTMENPKEMNPARIREERSKLLGSLKPLTRSEIMKKVIRGQYQGYLAAKGVSRGSQTETYFRIEAGLKSKRWQGVPIIMESGKGMKEAKTEIKVLFKTMPSCFCPDGHTGHKHQNSITFSIQPENKLNIRFWAKQPGLKTDIEPRDLSFDFSTGKDEIDAYEKVLHDAISGEQTLFTNSLEVQANWRFVSSILNNWQDLPLLKYKKGSKGPLSVKN
jgi:glucose-6-phosphate 1-dehydrogenase